MVESKAAALQAASPKSLPASAKVSPAATAAAGLACLIAVLAVDGTVAPGLERNRGLLSTSGTGYGCPLRCTALIASTAARLFRFLGLTASLTALRRRITTFAEELLVLGGKTKGLSAIAAHELLISSHRFLSSMLLVGRCSSSK